MGEHDWDWLGDRLALDFANTVRREGMEYQELLREPADLREWAAREHGRVPVPTVAAARRRLDEVRAARDDAFAVLRAAALSQDPPADAVRRLNERALAHPLVLQLGNAARVSGRHDDVDELLARVVADTIALAGSAGPMRLALCDAPSCGQLFLRDRDNKLWCGPACGTRARVARHAHRRRPGRAV